MADAKIALTAEDLTKPAVESAKAGLRSFGTTAVAVSGQTQQALRMLPAQITDIVTGLTSGQAPMTVLIQQGGQLKDMFGGMGAAARAVGGYIAGLINPVTLLAAGVGGLALAWHMADSEADAFARAIVNSGNAAGTTTAQLQVMAQRVAAIVGTVGQASDALTMLVATGQVPNENLERYAALIVRLEKVGVAAKDTAANLAALGKDPVAASLRLNESMNFLEASTLRQIKALVDLGKTQEAADLAQKAFADAQTQRIPQMEASIGRMESAWAKVLGVIKGVGSAVEDVFRQQPATAVLQRQIEEARQRNVTLGIGDSGGETARTRELQRQLGVLQQQQKAKEDQAAAAAKLKQQEQATEEFMKLEEASLSRQEKTTKEITRARNLGSQLIGTQKADGSTFGQADIDKVVGNINYENTKRAIESQITRLQTEARVLSVVTQAAVAEIEFERAIGNINERTSIEQSGAARINELERQHDLLEQQLELKKHERDTEKEREALSGQLRELDAQISSERLRNGMALLLLDDRREKAIRAVISAEHDEAQADQAKAISAAYAATNAAIGAQNEYSKSIKDANEQVDFEASLLGKTTDEQFKLNEQRRIELSLRERMRQIDALPSEIDAEARARLQTRAQADANTAIEKIDTRAYIDKWKSVNGQVSDGLYDALTGRGKDAADRLKDMFGHLVLEPVLKPVANMITNAIMGGIGGAGGQGGLGGLGGLASLGSTIGSGISSVAGFLGLGGAGAGSAANIAAAVGGGADGMAALGAGGAAAGAGIMGTIGTALPYVGVALLAAQALGLFKHGGPKTESGFGSGVPMRGDPSSSKAIAEGIQQQYASILGQIGVKGGPLDLGVFSATDPRGTAQTQLALTASLAGQSIYSREKRTGGIENVGRSDAELSAAVSEDSTRAIFAAIKATDGLSDSMKSILANTDAYGSSLEEVTTTLNRAVAAETQRKALDEKYFELSHNEQQNLQHQREQELATMDEVNKASAQRIYNLQDELKVGKERSDLEHRMFDLTGSAADILANNRTTELEGVDASNRALLKRIFLLEDEKKAQDEATAALDRARQSSLAIMGYLDRLTGTSAGLLDPQEQLTNARAQFERQYSLASGGNEEARGSITTYADQLIAAQSAYTAGAKPTHDTISYVEDRLARLVGDKLDQLTVVVADGLKRTVDSVDQVADNTSGATDANLLALVRAVPQ